MTPFRNYRRGWRLTLIALAASSVAASLFVLHMFGITLLEVKYRLAAAQRLGVHHRGSHRAGKAGVEADVRKAGLPNSTWSGA